MTKAQLIKRLADYPDDALVMILDGFNGGGRPREINLVALRVVEDADAAETADCEDLVDEMVVALGYGCY